MPNLMSFFPHILHWAWLVCGSSSRITAVHDSHVDLRDKNLEMDFTRAWFIVLAEEKKLNCS